MDEAAIRRNLDDLNPISNLKTLAKNKVPMFSVHGDNDQTLPFEENTLLLKQNDQAPGGSCEVKIISGRGHEVFPHFFQCQELVNFILKHAIH